MEIERKYLLSAMPAWVESSKEVRQGYLASGDPEVRVRQKGQKFFVTRKSGEGLVRREDESMVSMEVFDILWPATLGKRVEKARYLLTGPDGFVWEVDEYHGDLAGLFTAEVELPDESTKAAIPSAIKIVFVADVTEDKRYKNKNLAVHGLPK